MAVGGYILVGKWLAFGIDGYQIVGGYVTDGPSNPLHFEVAKGCNWLAAFTLRPWTVIALVLGMVGGLMAFLGLRAGREVSTLLFSKLAIFGMISSVVLTMFPFILPSSTDPKSSLTVWNASSSQLTLFIILVCTLIFLPLILMYTAWVYKVLWGNVIAADVTENSHSLY